MTWFDLRRINESSYTGCTNERSEGVAVAEPTGAFVAEVNRILGKEKYLLRKGDARGIAKAYLDSGAPPEPLDCKLLLEVAEEWMKDRPTLPRSKSEPAVIEPEPIPDDAVKEAADIVLRKLSETDDIVEDIVRDLVDVAVDEGRFRVVVDETPWTCQRGPSTPGNHMICPLTKPWPIFERTNRQYRGDVYFRTRACRRNVWRPRHVGRWSSGVGCSVRNPRRRVVAELARESGVVRRSESEVCHTPPMERVGVRIHGRRARIRGNFV